MGAVQAVLSNGRLGLAEGVTPAQLLSAGTATGEGTAVAAAAGYRLWRASQQQLQVRRSPMHSLQASTS